MSSSALSLFLTRLLESELLPQLVKIFLQWFQETRFRGIYRVKSHTVKLELLDGQGEYARYSKHQTVEFLTDGVIAIQDQAYGDGDLFIDYQCSPGVLVDSYREGYRYRLLISLRTTKNRGDVQEFQIQRTIKNGFLSPTGNFQTLVDHPTQELSLAIVFPSMRTPKGMQLIEQNTRRTRTLAIDEYHDLADGRIEVQVRIQRPRLYEGYIVRWEW